MTDIIASPPLALRRQRATKVAHEKSQPRLGLGALVSAVSEAFRLAYVAPYAPKSRSSALSEAELEGRDPNW